MPDGSDKLAKLAVKVIYKQPKRSKAHQRVVVGTVFPDWYLERLSWTGRQNQWLAKL